MQKNWPAIKIIIILCQAFALNGCTSTLIGAGSSVSLAALEERSNRQIAQDFSIDAKLRLKFLNAEKGFLIGLNVEVFNGQVLLTGVLEDNYLIADAISLAWDTTGVKDVINEIQIGKTNLKSLTIDTWITSLLTSKISLDRNIFAINYKIETVNRIIYLIGISQSQQELNQVLNHAKNIKGVKRVINYVKLSRAKK